MKAKTLVLIGGILLMVGAAAPWAVVRSSFLGASLSVNGLEGDGIFTAIGGAILFLIALLAKEQPGKTFSGFGVLVAIGCGLILALRALAVMGISVSSDSVAASMGIGLSCLSPLGVLLSLIGSLQRTPAAPVPQEQPAETPAA